MWLEERKLPPLDESTLKKAATFLPMFTSEWQASIDPESSEPPTDHGKFHYDGTFTPNPAIIGKWTTVAQVTTVEDFDPAAKTNPGRSPIRNIEFHSDGTTDSPSWIWTGNTLINLETTTAHKISTHHIQDKPYLTIESGGFSPKHPAGWTTPLMILKKD